MRTVSHTPTSTPAGTGAIPINPNRVDIAAAAIALAFGTGGLARLMAHLGGVDAAASDSPATQLIWIALAAFCALRLARVYRGSRWWNRVDQALLALILWSALTTLWSVAPALTVRRSVALALTVVIGAHLGLVVGRRRTQLLVVVTCSGMVAASLIGLATDAFVSIGEDDSVIGVFTHRNTLGFIAAVGLVATYRFVVDRPLLVWLARTLLAVGLIVSNSRTSQVALLASIAVLGLGRVWYLAPRIGVAVLSFVTASLVWFFMVFEGWQRFTALVGKDEDLTGRGELWGIVLNEASERPLGGFGFGALWAEYSPVQAAVAERFPGISSSHNTVFEFYAATGLVGAAILVVVLGRVWWREFGDFRIGVSGAAVWVALLTFFIVRGASEAGYPAHNTLATLVLVAVQVTASRRVIASQISGSG